MLKMMMHASTFRKCYTVSIHTASNLVINAYHLKRNSYILKVRGFRKKIKKCCSLIFHIK